MKPLADIPPPPSWRDIKQNIARGAMSRTGKNRMAFATLKSVGVIAILCACLWGGFEIYRAWESNPTSLKAPVKSEPLKTVTLRTDGVLDQAWLDRALALRKGIGMMELDLVSLRARLLANPQIRTAVLERKFPDTLIVVLEERFPVARIVVQQGPGDPDSLLVSRDGYIFAGSNFRPELLDMLPYLADVRLRRATMPGGASGFEPVEGMDTVADLLNTARGNIPNLYAGWRSISLGRLASDGVLVVRTRDMGQIIFGTRDDFYKQAAQLDYIVDNLRNQPDRGLPHSIDLSVGMTVSGTQIPVTFTPPAPPENARPIQSAAPSHNLPVRTAPQRPSTNTSASVYFQLPRTTSL